MTLIKICGITREQDALYCAARGVDFLGFIFVAESPRAVAPQRAAEIIAQVRRESQLPPKFVGVFRDASPDYIREVASTTGLDLVQMHGEECDDDLRAVGFPAIKACRVGSELPDTSAHPTAEWLLFDTRDDRRGGGTGRSFDWSLLAAYERSKPFFLSGGLTPENVGAAIALLRPDAIDLASGVEAEPGVKDCGRIDRLFERVRRTHDDHAS